MRDPRRALPETVLDILEIAHAETRRQWFIGWDWRRQSGLARRRGLLRIRQLGRCRRGGAHEARRKRCGSL